MFSVIITVEDFNLKNLKRCAFFASVLIQTLKLQRKFFPMETLPETKMLEIDSY